MNNCMHYYVIKTMSNKKNNVVFLQIDVLHPSIGMWQMNFKTKTKRRANQTCTVQRRTN